MRNKFPENQCQTTKRLGYVYDQRKGRIEMKRTVSFKWHTSRQTDIMLDVI